MTDLAIVRAPRRTLGRRLRRAVYEVVLTAVAAFVFAVACALAYGASW